MTFKELCMNPGPIEFDHRVLNELAAEGISHVDPAVIEVFGQCLEKLRKVFFAEDAQPFIVTGSGTLGWDMVGANLLDKGDEVLVINTGYFGDHLADCLECYGAKVTHCRPKKVGGQPSTVEVAQALNNRKFKMVTMTHVDTSTGVRTRIETLAKEIRKAQPDTLIVVDGVCAVGGEECRAKAWDLDLVLTGSQKCIGVPAGLSLMAARPRALKAFEGKQTKPTYYYVDWHQWLPVMQSYEARKPMYFATPAVNHILALNKGLDILLDNGGMEQRFKEHKMVAQAFQEAVSTLGCDLLTQSGNAAHTLTCVKFPGKVTGPELLPKVKSKGVALAGGLHKDVKTQYFRVGHMGPSSRRLDHILRTVQALESALEECGHKVSKKGEAAKCILRLRSDIPMVAGHKGLVGMMESCPVPISAQIGTVGIAIAAFTAGALAAMQYKK